VKKLGRYISYLFIVIVLLYVTGGVVRFALIRISCETEKKKAVEFTDFRLEVEDVSCDTIAKDEHIKVYVEKTLSKAAWFLPGWRNRRTRLFEYDPGRWDNPLPSITISSPNTLLVSVPEVSSILYENHAWEGMSITYDIGKVDYPDPLNPDSEFKTPEACSSVAQRASLGTARISKIGAPAGRHKLENLYSQKSYMP
jgi:hypothetical protein